MGLINRPNGRPRAFNEEQENIVIEKYVSGMPIARIANDMGKRRTAIRNVINRHVNGDKNE